MKTTLLSTILTVLLFQCNMPLEAQTYNDATMQEYYWRFRERFRKHHVYIGLENGQSMIVEIHTGESVTLQTFNATTKQKTGSPDEPLSGCIEMGDGGVDLGNYLAFLASEYAV